MPSPKVQPWQVLGQSNGTSALGKLEALPQMNILQISLIWYVFVIYRATYELFKEIL